MNDLSLALSRRGLNGLRLFLHKFWAQGLLFVIPILYALSNIEVLGQFSGHNEVSIANISAWFASFCLPVGIVTLILIRLMLSVRAGESPVQNLSADIVELSTSPQRMMNGFPAIFSILLIYKYNIELKVQIPKLHPFDWDPYFARLDRLLHFGFDPWVLLHPFLGFEFATLICNDLYLLWFFVMFAAVLWFGFQEYSTPIRSQFFLAFGLLWWIGGGFLALYFSSAGPAYYSAIGLPNDPYVGLMKYLKGVNEHTPVWSLMVQDRLWDGYTGKFGPVGISSFPSMHNGTMFLIAIAFRKISKLLSNLVFVFTFGVFLGSIHLGWHYAVDGYAAFALAAFFWWIAGYVARWFHNLPGQSRIDSELRALNSLTTKVSL